MTAEFSPGSRLGEYVLDAYIGAGSFGIVWRGHAEASGETVAIKLLTGALSSGNAASMRGAVELLAATAGSRSPHVVRVLGGGSQPVPYIVMEYVQGTDLAAMLQTETKLTPARTIDVGLAIAGALQVLNQARIVHRDIKPANVLVDTQGVIKLTDFGVAKIVGYETITMTGQVAMTMAYAAPEVWEDDDDADTPFGRPSHRSDLYALGILLYQCLCGVTPFRGNYGVLYRAHRERAPDLSSLPEGTPASLREAIRRCLEKRQADRPVDATETYRILERASVELAEANGSLPPGEPARFGPWLRVGPHASLPWAWRCKNDVSGLEVTVEVLFADDVDVGNDLRRVTRANAGLTALGAEKIIESNRLLLRPQEAWTAAPAGEFQFWVAREDRNVEPAKSLSQRALSRGVLALDALIEASVRAGIGLSLRDNLTLTTEGEIYVRRAGLAPASEYLLEQAMATIRALPLDAEARALVAAAGDFANLVLRAATAAGTGESIENSEPAGTSAPENTELVCRRCHAPMQAGQLICAKCGHYQVRDSATTVLSTPDAATTLLQQAPGTGAASASGTSVQARLQDLGGGEYELVLTNPGPMPRTMMLSATSKETALRVVLPPSVMMLPSSVERVKVSVTRTQRRWLGGKRSWQFTIVASGGGGSDEPPLTIEGEFEDQPPLGPIVAAATAGALVVALITVLGASLLTKGDGKASAGAASAKATTVVEATKTAAAPQEPTPPVPVDVAAPAVPPATSGNAASAPAAPAPLSGAQQASVSTPRVLPTLAASSSTRVCPTAPPTNDAEQFKGCRIYEAVMDGTARSFIVPFYSGACGTRAVQQGSSDLRFTPGAMELEILKQYGQTNITLNALARSTYVMEFELSFRAGSENEVVVRLRTSSPMNIYLAVDARSETLRLFSYNPGTDVATDLTPRTTVPGLRTGRKVTIAAAVGLERYSAFLDGKLVIDYRDSRFQGTQKLYIEAQACGNSPGLGIARITAARVYELAGQ